MNEPHAELESLLAALLEDGATSAQRERLGELLREHPALRAEYVRQMRVHALLQFAAGRTAAGTEPGAAENAGNIVRFPPPRVWRVAAVAASVALLAGAMFWFSRPGTGERSVADAGDLDARITAAEFAANGWRVPSDPLLDAVAGDSSHRIAGLVGDINALLQP
ncbi:MAG: hypothetical protein L0Z50_17180 [Verrucomicrobiales bacterium]|nr:hypothetical protein [Verrucomicrobiales bacterium]